MKKALLVFLSVVGVYTAQAQTFTTSADTVFAMMNPTDGTVDVHNDISPVGSGPITIDWHIVSQNLPSSVLTADNGFGICDNIQCYNYVAGSNMGAMHTTDPITSSNTGSKLFKIVMDASSYPSSALGPYYIKVMLMDHNDPTSTKDVVFGIQRFPTSVSSVSKNNDDISVYPNPAKNDINVVFGANANVKNISVYNLIGKVVSVYKVTGNSAKLDLSNIPSGIYYMRLVDNAGRIVATRKFTHQ